MASLTIYLGHDEPLIGYFIAPDGSDSSGDGSADSPWRTLGKFYSVAVAGDTLWCRGGSYTGNVGDVGITVTSAGTAVAPIIVNAYPGETPVFDGTGASITDQNSAIQFSNGAAYHEIHGLTIRDWAWWPGRNVGGNGSAFILSAAYSTTVSHITVEDCTFIQSAGVLENQTQQDHLFYIAPNSSYITMRRCILTGAGTGDYRNFGAGVTLYHDPGGSNHLIERCIFSYTQWGFNINQDVDGVSILHNTFHHNRMSTWSQAGTNILVRDNASQEAGGFDYVSGDCPGYVADHNFSSQGFDANWYLTTGETGRNAASDGSDAGALDW
jgi:hypothetical protein